MYILIDIGGSGIKIADYSNGVIGRIEKHGLDSFKSFDDFVNAIRARCGRNLLWGIAISAAGFVNSEEGKIISCANAKYLEGDTVRKLKREFPLAKITVVNDGEAHARALLYPKRNVKLGAIHLAFGTYVALGVINNRGKIVRTCNGENWDIGDYVLKTSEAPYEVWEKLGRDALEKLENKHSDDPYYHFGQRAGGLLNNLAVIFRPRTIGISGGIITSHGRRILDGIKSEVKTPVFSEPIEFVMLDGEKTVMEGLTTLL